MRQLWSLQRQQRPVVEYDVLARRPERQSRPCMHHATQHCRLARSACRARLPHMDEEIEHMQWQLDKRTHDDHDKQRSSKSRSDGSQLSGKTNAGKQRQHVFHDKARIAHHHHRLSEHRQVAAAGSRPPNSKSLSDISVEAALDSCKLQQTSANCSPIEVANLKNHQNLNHSHLKQQEPQYYHLQLRHNIDLSRARDRVCKHIAQDGGCYLSAQSACTSLLTHFLLLLQHKQQQKDPTSLLVVQPVVAHKPLGSSASAQAPSRIAGASSSSSNRAMVQGSSPGHPTQSDPGHTQLWVTVMPIDMVLELQAEPIGIATDRAGASRAPSCNVSSSSDSFLSGSLDSPMESSGEDAIYSSSSSRASGKRDAADGALLTAAGRHNNALAALLQRSVDSGAPLRHIRVGMHAECQAIAADVAAAAAIGQLVSLRAKGHAAAHTVAFTALGQAASWPHSGQSPRSFGVVLVPAFSYEHVHAVMHGHTGAEGSVASGHKVGHDRRVATDASMAVGGFGAAYYGLKAGDGSASDMGLLHRPAQEVWLCVVPFATASE